MLLTKMKMCKQNSGARSGSVLPVPTRHDVGRPAHTETIKCKHAARRGSATGGGGVRTDGSEGDSTVTASALSAPRNYSSVLTRQMSNAAEGSSGEESSTPAPLPDVRAKNALVVMTLIKSDKNSPQFCFSLLNYIS